MNTILRRLFLLCTAAVVLSGGGSSPHSSRQAPIFGTVASELTHVDAGYAAGLRAVTFEIYWDRLQPARDRFDDAQFDQARRDLQAFRDAGMAVVLDLGLQYPPAWAFNLPHSRYVNQYGDTYVDDRPGANGLNAVFNQQVRDLQAAYVERVFQELGDEAYAVRLGWCFYGELSYPIHMYADRTNAYWAYDEISQTRTPGLPETLSPNPVPDWVPGMQSDDHAAARRFATWYLDALTDYQSWQIATVRRYYDGRLAILYPSWGLRPEQLEAAVRRDLSGFTPPEQNGEIQRGHDFARHVASLSDRNVVLYTTWLDAPAAFVDEAEDRPSAWSPAHFLRHLADDHRPRLPVWGENTGSGSVADMQLCFERLRAFDLAGLFWAFDHQLHDNDPTTASIDDYAAMVETALAEK